jgi:hypothetical protein
LTACPAPSALGGSEGQKAKKQETAAKKVSSATRRDGAFFGFPISDLDFGFRFPISDSDF